MPVYLWAPYSKTICIQCDLGGILTSSMPILNFVAD